MHVKRCLTHVFSDRQMDDRLVWWLSKFTDLPDLHYIITFRNNHEVEYSSIFGIHTGMYVDLRVSVFRLVEGHDLANQHHLRTKRRSYDHP